MFLDWYLPWWVGILLYCIIAAAWLVCFYSTLLYGIKFGDEKVRVYGEKPAAKLEC